jgi:DNA excision repair protein ERCC-4
MRVRRRIGTEPASKKSKPSLTAPPPSSSSKKRPAPLTRDDCQLVYVHPSAAHASPDAAALQSDQSAPLWEATQLRILITPIRSLGPVLLQERPSFVIMYASSVAALRQLEVYQATVAIKSGAATSLTVTLLEALNTAAFAASLERENTAFESLIQQKAVMVVSAEQEGRIGTSDTPAAGAGGVDSSAEHSRVRSFVEKSRQVFGQDLGADDGEGVRHSSFLTYLQGDRHGAVGTRRGGLEKSADSVERVLVDMREFRSSLPSILHLKGFLVEPITLEVGDYILSTNICVERKSLFDLIQSLQSGRLYRQAEMMIRYYKLPALLIEVLLDNPFLLLQGQEIPSQILGTHIISRLALLILHFPTVRLLWAHGPYNTTSIFTMLKKNQEQPDASTAVFARGDGKEDDNEQASLLTPFDILRRLPGINVYNIHKVLRSVTCLVSTV